ncbi:hypothetical protein [Francisella marina]|uniref:6-bladed beta-propeller n=1 Tax=Francisella marina TaxID=2249302 RepID=A0ABX5ZH99_9GAMM|nr:hypothetical protein [Francisella marina]QEO57542.1 hypothetical protein F0R74_06640 [Francisella marina]
MDYYLTTRDEVAGVGGNPVAKKISQINFPYDSYIGVSGEALSDRVPLVIDSNGKLYMMDLNNTDKPLAGFSLNATTGADESVRVAHGYVNGYTGLTPGQTLFATANGFSASTTDPDYYYINENGYEVAFSMTDTIIKTFEKVGDFRSITVSQAELQTVLDNYSTETGYTNMYYGNTFDPTPTGINSRGFGQVFFTQPVENYRFRAFYYDNIDNWQVHVFDLLTSEDGSTYTLTEIHNNSRSTLTTDFFLNFRAIYSPATQYDPAYIQPTMDYNPDEPVNVKFVVQWKRI